MADINFNYSIILILYILFFLFYWFIFKNNLKFQNLLILAGSYIFYGLANWRFLPFLIGVSALNFYLGIYIEKTQQLKHKRLLLYIGLFQGIGSLVYFKYYNFFIASFNDIFQALPVSINLKSLNIIVPLGISFFTFRTISYLLDIEKGKIKPVTDAVVFFNYVSFFPTILSGPIDKARDFIPQLEKKRLFDYVQASDGMRQILWGLYKKIVIADNCALLTNQLFINYQGLPASSLLLGSFLYTVQVYADFSGYSDLAIGSSRLIGFNITKNFNFPFYAQNIAEFWRKWHISLTSWFAEYVFTPLNITLRDYGRHGLITAILINFTIIGFWHGANWTYILFGFLHGCCFIPLILKGAIYKKGGSAENKPVPAFIKLLNMTATFTYVMLTFIVFRSETIGHAYLYYKGLFSNSLFSAPVIPFTNLKTSLIVFILVMFVIEWLQRGKEHGLQMEHIMNPMLRLAVYYAAIFIIIMFGAATSNQFIYIKF